MYLEDALGKLSQAIYNCYSRSGGNSGTIKQENPTNETKNLKGKTNDNISNRFDLEDLENLVTIL